VELLRVEGVTKRFGNLVAVDNVSFTIREGELVAIIGPNGAGKTTLVNLITKKLEPDQGRIFFRGMEITRLPAHSIARLGLVRTFQIVSIFPNLTVEENLAIATLRSNASRSDLERVVEEFKLKEYMGRKAGTLPLGVQKLLELSMSLLLKPKLLILDEPAAGLGPEDRVSLIETLARLRSQTNILIIEHDMNVVFKLADRIIVMDRGRIVADGSPEEIRGNKYVREIYLGEE